MFQNFDDDSSINLVATRVKALRARLIKLKLDGLIVPREDEYQGEYVPAANERLKYISGFGGSAGTAIILARKAALFVDGRYILQAPKQTDTKLYSIVDILQTAPSQWLATTVNKGMEIGLDPRLHSETAVKAYRDRLAAKGARLVLLDENPLDADWHDRPELPDTPVVIQPTRFVGRTSKQKRKALAAEMKQAGHDFLLIAQPENIAWLLNIRAADVPHTPFALSFGLLNKNGSFDWFIRKSRVDATVRAHIGSGLRLHRQVDMLAKLKALKGKTVAFDPSNTPAWFAEQMSNTNLVRVTDPCALPKAAKHKAEIKASIAAHEMDGAAAPSISCAAMLALISALCFAAFGRAHGSVTRTKLVLDICSANQAGVLLGSKATVLPFNAFSLASISTCLCRRKPLPIWARTVASTRLLRMNQSKLPFLLSSPNDKANGVCGTSAARMFKSQAIFSGCAINKKSCPACFISAASALRFCFDVRPTKRVG